MRRFPRANQFDDLINQEKESGTVRIEFAHKQNDQIVNRAGDLRTNSRIRAIGMTMLMNRIG